MEGIIGERRPTKRTPEVVAKMAEAVASGLTDEEASLLAGVNPDTTTECANELVALWITRLGWQEKASPQPYQDWRIISFEYQVTGEVRPLHRACLAKLAANRAARHFGTNLERCSGWETERSIDHGRK
jgi:hypothetical protein